MTEEQKQVKKDEQTLWFKLAIVATLLLGSVALFRDQIQSILPKKEVVDTCSISTVDQKIGVFLSDPRPDSTWRKVDGISVGLESVLVKSDFDHVSVEEDVFSRKIGMLHLAEAGAQKLFNFTAANVGKWMVVLVDDHIVATFEITSMGVSSAISIQGVLHGYATSQDVVRALCSNQ